MLSRVIKLNTRPHNSTLNPPAQSWTFCSRPCWAARPRPRPAAAEHLRRQWASADLIVKTDIGTRYADTFNVILFDRSIFMISINEGLILPYMVSDNHWKCHILKGISEPHWSLQKIFTVVVLLGEVRVLDAGADVAIVLLPVVEEGEDGVDEEQQHQAQDHQLL